MMRRCRRTPQKLPAQCVMHIMGTGAAADLRPLVTGLVRERFRECVVHFTRCDSAHLRNSFR